MAASHTGKDPERVVNGDRRYPRRCAGTTVTGYLRAVCCIGIVGLSLLLSTRSSKRRPDGPWRRTLSMLRGRKDAPGQPGGGGVNAAGKRPPAEAVVVRGGQLNLSDLRKNAETTATVKGRAGISVQVAVVAERREMLVIGNIPHPRLSFSTAGRIYDAGFDLEQTGAFPHHTLWLPDDWREGDALERVKDAFDPPIDRSEA